MNASTAVMETTTNDSYDSQGALIFTVVVLIIFGSSILAFIGYSIKAMGKDRSMTDREVQQFLSTKSKVHQLTALDEVSLASPDLCCILINCGGGESGRLTQVNTCTVWATHAGPDDSESELLQHLQSLVTVHSVLSLEHTSL